MTDRAAAEASHTSPPPASTPAGEGRRVGREGPDGRDRLIGLTARREDAFPEAVRHSARVVKLRRWIVWGVGALIGLVALGLLVSSLRFLPVDLNLARVALQGTRIVIETPKLVGYRKDGRPYEVRARVGIQDITKPDVFDLDGLDVRVETQGESPISLTAPKAVYSAKADHAEMSGGVRITDAVNFDMRVEKAAMDFRASVMTSDTPVTLEIQGGEVRADQVEFAQKERRATFSGNVRSVLYGEDGTPPGGLRALQ